jgi:hypothetical protein
LTTRRRNSWLGFYIDMLWIILFVPTFAAQHYIHTVTGKRAVLQNIAEVEVFARAQTASYVQDTYKTVLTRYFILL